MPGFPTSPRLRRRLLRIGVAVAATGTIAALVVFVPSNGPATPAAQPNEGPAQIALPAKTYRVTAAERRAIDATLDRFIPAAMERRSPETAWALAGPELRSNSSLAAWRKGSSPVPFYPARETTFHQWTTIEVGRDDVLFNLLLHPKAASKSLGSYVFAGEVVERHGHWLVNRIYTIAIMNNTPTTHETGPADFAAPAAASQTPKGKPVLGGIGILPVVAILALILLIPLSLGVVALLRARRWRRQTRIGARNRPLPTLSDYHSGRETPPQKNPEQP